MFIRKPKFGKQFRILCNSSLSLIQLPHSTFHALHKHEHLNFYIIWAVDLINSLSKNQFHLDSSVGIATRYG